MDFTWGQCALTKMDQNRFMKKNVHAHVYAHLERFWYRFVHLCCSTGSGVRWARRLGGAPAPTVTQPVVAVTVNWLIRSKCWRSTSPLYVTKKWCWPPHNHLHTPEPTSAFICPFVLHCWWFWWLFYKVRDSRGRIHSHLTLPQRVS